MDFYYQDSLLARLDELAPRATVLTWLAVIDRCQKSEEYQQKLAYYCQERDGIATELRAAQNSAQLVLLEDRIDALLNLELRYRDQFNLAELNNQGIVLLGPGRDVSVQTVVWGELRALVVKTDPGDRTSLMRAIEYALRMVRAARVKKSKEKLADAAWKIQKFVGRIQQLLEPS